MKKVGKYVILISAVICLLTVVGIICVYGGDNIINEVLFVNGDDNAQQDDISEDIDPSDDIVDTDDDDSINKNTGDNNIDNTSNYTEDDVIEYFSVMEEEVSGSSSFKDKFKKYFVIIVDFIFYDKEIKGYTFSELSDTAKAKIIGMALKIDSEIEEYIPNYKDNISSAGNKIYTNIKERLVTLYLDTSIEVCKNSEEGCEKVKEMFSEIKEVCIIGWDFIKNLAYSGVDRLKEWYEVYSGK